MKRSRIVLSATAFGSAAVLGFHAHPASTPVATAASTKTTATAATPVTTSTTTTSSGSGSATGEAMNTRYGPAQVKVTVANGKITKIEPVQLQSSDPKSQQISSYAAPILQQS